MPNKYRKYLGLETPGYTPPLLRSEENRTNFVFGAWKLEQGREQGFRVQ
jgi:hypothetical protein